MKARILASLKKIHFLATPIYWVATAALIITIALPIVYPSFDTLYWFAALATTAFLFSSGAIIDIAHQHSPTKTGLAGWFSQLWNVIMYWAWLVATGFLVIFLFKIVSYMLTH